MFYAASLTAICVGLVIKTAVSLSKIVHQWIGRPSERVFNHAHKGVNFHNVPMAYVTHRTVMLWCILSKDQRLKHFFFFLTNVT